MRLLTMCLTLSCAALVMTSSNAASAQDKPFASEDQIVVKRSYVAACEANLDALAEAGRWVDRTDGALAECQRHTKTRDERVEALVRDNDRMATAIEEAPNRWVWFGAGAGSALVAVLVFVLVR